MYDVNQFLTTGLALLTSSISYGWRLVVQFILIVPLNLAYAQDYANLKAIQTDIEKHEQRIKQQQTDQAKLHQQLQQHEKAINRANQQLQQTQKSLDELNAAITHLSNSINQLQRQQQKQLNKLTYQINQSLKIGPQETAQAIFDNERYNRNQRMQAYWHYLNLEREKNITALKKDLLTITDQRYNIQQLHLQKKALLDKQQNEQRELEQAKQQREQTLQKLNASLTKDQLALETLKQNEQLLRQQIAQAERRNKERQQQEAKEVEHLRQRQQQAKITGNRYQTTPEEQALIDRTEGLNKKRQRVDWPVTGKLLHLFGEHLRGEIYWKGIVIAAPEGSEVKAITAGRVLLADWLQGYGFVVVIEHGKNDLTLYGYNQQTYVTVGEQVKTGQVIASVGKSGGQTQPALYFEIRHQGRAVNPLLWLKK